MLLPAELINRLNHSQRLALLVHELAHIKRGDPWVRILELLVSVAYWWLPAVGACGRRLRACEERCSDATVVALLPDARQDYARLLLDVVDFTSPLPLRSLPGATAMSALAHELEHRLRAILESKKSSRYPLPSAAVAIGLACAILPCHLGWNFARVDPSAIPLVDRATASNATPTATSVHSVDLSTLCCPST
jgi:beta-lactamase regulating signal transducer with metallopeptidase domain